ncbi:MBL fold metallo-hydrolase [Ochrobactrum teleogrylli]|uniref:MBL fold metallo-hydrolase n=1 Tax=Ochrobactrum teleogrylli TaxID=2479765 RepID=UPI003628AE58
MSKNSNFRERALSRFVAYTLFATTLLPASTLLVTGALAAPIAGVQQETAGWVGEQVPGVYRMKLGDFRITVLSDGTAPRDLPKIMSNPDEVRAAFDASHQSLPIELSINAFLIDTGAHRILVDAGAGELFGAPSGQLLSNMRAAGYQPADIDTILLTHIHGDHSGGLSVGGKRVFENATVYVDQRDPAYWLDAKTEADAPANRKLTFTQSHQTVDPYITAGKLKTFDGATELFAGVRTVPEHGHTRGLTGYMIESKGQRLLLWGDVIHAAEVQFRDPSVTVDYDVDPKQAAASREKILSDASDKGYLVGAAHISFPGLGHVRKEDKGYSWVPVPYSVVFSH